MPYLNRAISNINKYLCLSVLIEFYFHVKQHNYKGKQIFISHLIMPRGHYFGDSKVKTTNNILTADTIYSLNVYSLSPSNGLKSFKV